MDNNDSNPKPQQTGGLKLMTVFIAVLALHVVVIGGFTVYHLMSGGSTDADLVTDKTHKGVKVSPDTATVSDGTLPDPTADKSTSAASSPTDESGTPMTIPAPSTTTASEPATTAQEATASSAPSTTPETTAPAATTPPASLPSPVNSEPTASVPSGPIRSGPVVMPATPQVPAETTTASNLDASDAAPANAPASVTSGHATYTVKSHDSMARIAHKNHVSVASLRAANSGIKNDTLRVGEKLVIPSHKPTPTSLAALREPNTTLLGDSDFSKLPTKKSASRTHELSSSSSTGGSRHTYTVIKGDTLNKIARRFHTSSNAIMALNNISDARKLRLGQKLRIPSQESRSATSAPEESTPPHEDRIEPRATPSAQLANFIN